MMLPGAIPPKGRSLASICVTAVLVVLSTVVVCTRLWVRNRARKRAYLDWDDILALLGLVFFIGTSILISLGNCYGIGVPPAEFDDRYLASGLQFFVFGEIAYCVSSASIKTSIGLALVRTICVKRRYRYTVFATIAVSSLVFVGGVIWFCTSCRPMSATWDRIAAAEPGACHYGGYLVLISLIFAIAFATDVAFAVVPLLALRRLRMAPRTKYPLMAVFSLGILAAVASACRFPFIHMMRYRFSPTFLYEMCWIGILSVIECSIGLIAGSMPFIGRLFNLYESGKPRSDAGRPNLVNPTIGGTPARGVRNKSSSIPLFSRTETTNAGGSSGSSTSFIQLEEGQDSNDAKDEGIGLQKSHETDEIVQSPEAIHLA